MAGGTETRDETVADPTGHPPPRKAAMGSSFLLTFGGSVGSLVLNLFTGIVSARLLGPEGRGVVGAITAWVIIVALIGNLGVKDGLSYVESRDHRRSAKVLTLTVASVSVMSVVAVLISEIFVPIGFRAQSDEAVRQAQIFMIWVIPTMSFNGLGSQFGARQRFGAVTAMRVGQPFLYAVGLAVMWARGSASVVDILVLQVATFYLICVVAVWSLWRESGFGPLDLQLGRESWRYGIRSFGTSFGVLANTRLDQMILPAFVLADEIGLYVVAVRAAGMVVGLFGSLGLVLFPATARAERAEAIQLSQRAIRLVFVLSLVSSVVLFLAAELAIDILYGSEFGGAVVSLRLLLPGVVFWSTSAIITSVLKGLGHPVAASVAQFIGLGLTVVGLAVTLGPFGIEGAAVTSSVSYFTVCAVGFVQFLRVSGTKWSQTISASSIAGDLVWFRARLGRVATNAPV